MGLWPSLDNHDDGLGCGPMGGGSKAKADNLHPRSSIPFLCPVSRDSLHSVLGRSYILHPVHKMGPVQERMRMQVSPVRRCCLSPSKHRQEHNNPPAFWIPVSDAPFAKREGGKNLKSTGMSLSMVVKFQQEGCGSPASPHPIQSDSSLCRVVHRPLYPWTRSSSLARIWISVDL